MAASRCGCASDTCSCVVVGGDGISVSGSGSRTNPYLIDAFGVAATDLLAGGRVTASLTNTAITLVAVTFPVGKFADPPVVFATVNSVNPYILANTGEPSETGVLLIVFHRDAANVTVDVPVSWIARRIG